MIVKTSSSPVCWMILSRVQNLRLTTTVEIPVKTQVITRIL